MAVPLYFLLLLNLASVTLSTPVSSTETIHWKSCTLGNQTYDSRFSCAIFSTYLDYADPSAGQAHLAVARFANRTGPRLGTIWFNPGGPGESGVDEILQSGEYLSKVTGGQYDIASWDSRGVGATLPAWNCFESAAEEYPVLSASYIEIKNNFTDPKHNDPDEVAFLNRRKDIDDSFRTLGSVCKERNGNLGKYVGSMATVRDILALNDAVEGKGKRVNFWGISHGTILGSYLLSVFPERAGRVIIDGVVNPKIYRNLPGYDSYSYQAIEVPNVFNVFVEACAQVGHQRCALANPNSTTTSDDVRQTFLKLYNTGFDYARAGGAISSFMIRRKMLLGLYNPSTWSSLASELVSLNRTMATIPSLSNPLIIPSQSTAPTYTWNTEAIWCADAADDEQYGTEQVLQAVVNASTVIDQALASTLIFPGFYCHRWPVRAVERHPGKFTIDSSKLESRALVIANTGDPVTPKRAALDTLALLGGPSVGVLLEQRGVGHTSVAQQSKCTAIIIQAYFVNGTLPQEGVICPVDDVLFS